MRKTTTSDHHRLGSHQEADVMTAKLHLRRILVPTDFSEPADRAWRYAQALAGPSKARLHALHVVTPPYFYDAWGTERAAQQMSELLAATERAADRGLARLAARSRAAVGRVVTARASGSAVDRILEYVAKNRIDLIVMGTHGRSGVDHLLLGSVAERIVQRSPVPVLTVHGRSGARRPSRRARRR
jgi:nucleotide-binding universal stress UspA family protein